MKVKCKHCKHEIEFDESKFKPGEVITVECPWCADDVEVTIPSNEEVPKKPKVKVTRKEGLKKVEKSEVVEPEVSQPYLPQSSISMDDKVENEIIQPAKPTRKRSTKITGKSTPKLAPSDVDKADRSMLKFEKPEPEFQEISATPPQIPKPQRKTATNRKTAPQRTPNNTHGYTGGSQTRTNKDIPTNKDGILGCIILLVLIALVVIASIWLFRSCSDSDGDAETVVDSVAVEVVPYVEDEPEVVLQDYYSEMVDTVACDSMMVEESIIPADTIVSVGGEQMEEAESSQASCMMGFHSGKNSFVGDMIHTDGRRFPFTLEFDYFPEDNKISDVVYVNTTSSTKLKLETTEFTHSMVRFEGKDGGKKFILQFSNTQPYSGDAWWGDFHQNIELNLK